MKLLDLFCGAGGCSKGYHDAGFDDITGIDINPMPHYPYKIIQGDAIEYLREHGKEYDFIHASPPCQAYSKASTQWRKEGKDYPDLIVIIREMLIEIGKPYVIENVPGSPLIDPFILNGEFFNMKVRRTRLFETSFPMPTIELPKEEKSNFKMGRWAKEGDIIVPVGHFTNVDYARRVMGIDWMTRDELSQAIPPIYTKYIGTQYLQMVEA
jgi:DNA (cytosine-5)-methyltransferase 1